MTGGDWASLRRKNTELWKGVFAEDVGVCEGMQQGRMSESFDGGRFSPVMDGGVHLFHAWIAGNMSKVAAAAEAAVSGGCEVSRACRSALHLGDSQRLPARSALAALESARDLRCLPLRPEFLGERHRVQQGAVLAAPAVRHERDPGRRQLSE